MAETVACVECTKTISRSDAVAGVSPQGWICRTCFGERAQREDAIVRRAKKRGVVLAVIGFVVFILGVALTLGATFMLTEMPMPDGSYERRDMLQGSIELYVMIVGVAVAGLALALTGLMKARRKSKFEGIVPGA